MLNIALLDDEQYVLRGLEELLVKEGFSVCGCYTNGQQLLEELDQKLLEPQVVIADIRMPDMDGISFLQELRQRNLDIYSILLSGYNDFDYARRAIEYRTYRYLLKPLDEKELIDCLHAIQSDLESRSSLANWESYSFDLMFHNAILEQPIQPISSIPAPSFCQLLSIYFLGSEETLKKELIKWCTLHGFAGRFFLQDNRHLLLLIFSFEAHQKEGSFSTLLPLMIQENAYAGISGAYQNFSDLPEMYLQSRKALFRKFITSSRITLYSSIDFGLLPSCHDESQGLITAICLSDRTKAELSMNTIFRLCGNTGQIIPVFIEIADFFKQYSLSHSEPFRKEIFSIIQDMLCFETFHSIYECQNNIRQCIEKIFILCENASKKSSNSKIEKAMAFIQKNYNRDISLQETANTLGISANYLSNLFRKTTNQGFVEYLIEYRIQKAKELLLHTNHKIHEISFMVGFHETKYFIRTFKKNTGMSPTTYRQYAKN